MLKFISAILFLLVFCGLAIGSIGAASYLLYLVNPYLAYIFPAYYLLMVMGNNYARDALISLDQTWQTTFSPILNLWPNKYKFGSPDESASSVVGKNLRATNGLRWKMIELVLSLVLELGKPHSIKSIEEDEGS